MTSDRFVMFTHTANFPTRNFVCVSYFSPHIFSGENRYMNRRSLIIASVHLKINMSPHVVGKGDLMIEGEGRVRGQVLYFSVLLEQRQHRFSTWRSAPKSYCDEATQQ